MCLKSDLYNCSMAMTILLHSVYLFILVSIFNILVNYLKYI